MPEGEGLRAGVCGQSSSAAVRFEEVTRAELAGLRGSLKSRLRFRHTEAAGDAKVLQCVI